MVSGHIELFVLYSGSAVLTGAAVDRNDDASENLYVYLDDRDVFESQ